MRIHIKLSRNREIVPFNFQERQVSLLHRWMGRDNPEHGQTSLYSFSWLKSGEVRGERGYDFPLGTEYFISTYNPLLLKSIIDGITADNYFGFGMEVSGIVIQKDPEFSITNRFLVGSPVFLKKKEGERFQFYYPGDNIAGELLSQTLKTKLLRAGLSTDGVEVSFDQTYKERIRKGVSYKGIFNKGAICPVIVSGSSEQIAFAWNVGVGNSTGIGFGSLV